MGRRSNRFSCGSQLRVVTVLLVATVGTLGVAVGGDAKESAQSQFRIDHFQCYRVDPGSEFKPRRVVLVDQFDRARAEVLRLYNLCPPVKKNRVGIRNELAHLACYTLRPRRTRAAVVTIKNQFESRRLSVGRPTELCLPTAKRLRPEGRPRPVRGLDHYQCRLVKPTTAPRVRPPALEDQFGPSRPVIAGRARLCAPVRKDVGRVTGRVLNRRDHLVCYLLRPREQFRPLRAFIFNQFGDASLTVARPEWLCVPTIKRLVRPDLTVAIPSRTDVGCPGGPGTCVMTVNFTVTNAGAVGVSTPFETLVEVEPGLSRTVVMPALAAGASQSFNLPVGPGGNCYNPDCTVRVTVDVTSAVGESNEANNSATRTDLG